MPCRSAVLLAGAVTALVIMFHSAPASAGGFTVNLTIDQVDANVADGRCDVDSGTAGDQCTLRAAVQQANASAGQDSIQLPADTFTLTMVGTDDAAASGDLDITGDVTIDGISAGSTIIQAGNEPGTGIDRVIHVLGDAQVTLSDVTIRHGSAPGARGGGIYSFGQLTIESATISSNNAANGGGVFMRAAP
jgi:hypothetical protein